MIEPASISEAATYFDVAEETVRRWIRAGCPCAQPGEIGRGHGAKLNLADVARWRAARAGSESAAPPSDIMQRVETALLDVLRRDGGNGRPIASDLGISHEQAVELLVHAQRRIRRALDGGG